MTLLIHPGVSALAPVPWTAELRLALGTLLTTAYAVMTPAVLQLIHVGRQRYADNSFCVFE